MVGGNWYMVRAYLCDCSRITGIGKTVAQNADELYRLAFLLPGLWLPTQMNPFFDHILYLTLKWITVLFNARLACLSHLVCTEIEENFRGNCQFLNVSFCTDTINGSCKTLEYSLPEGSYQSASSEPFWQHCGTRLVHTPWWYFKCRADLFHT